MTSPTGRLSVGLLAVVSVANLEVSRYRRQECVSCCGVKPATKPRESIHSEQGYFMRLFNFKLVSKREGRAGFLRNALGELRFSVIPQEDSHAHTSLGFA
jgi:hypothetical protein